MQSTIQLSGLPHVSQLVFIFTFHRVLNFHATQMNKVTIKLVRHYRSIDLSVTTAVLHTPTSVGQLVLNVICSLCSCSVLASGYVREEN